MPRVEHFAEYLQIPARDRPNLRRRKALSHKIEIERPREESSAQTLDAAQGVKSTFLTLFSATISSESAAQTLDVVKALSTRRASQRDFCPGCWKPPKPRCRKALSTSHLVSHLRRSVGCPNPDAAKALRARFKVD